jgi:deoxyribose-phosphate aldolase
VWLQVGGSLAVSIHAIEVKPFQVARRRENSGHCFMSHTHIADLAAKTDLAYWKPIITPKEFAVLCADARAKGIRAVSVNSSRLIMAVAGLEDSAVQVVALIGFPMGTSDSDVKRYEAEVAVDFGAQEIELILNLDHLKNNSHRAMMRELNDVVEAVDERNVCVVLETRALTRAELIKACEFISDSGVKCVSTGTDFWPDSRVDADDIKAIRDALNAKISVKATGNIRDAETAQQLIDAGAARIGTTSLSLFKKL